MRPTRQPAEHVLGGDDAEREGAEGAVQSGEDEAAARRDQGRAGVQKALLVRDVLDNFHGAHQVELAAFGDQLAGGRHPVVDGEPGGAGVAGGDLDAGRRQIDPGDR
ncbi:MAG TPA: hypothetical protein VHI72_09535, partial [Hyphomicrobiaceae bacterium]|nr:hypothetical protein [Hyphomicrobiaceae bacterium]